MLTPRLDRLSITPNSPAITPSIEKEWMGFEKLSTNSASSKAISSCTGLINRLSAVDRLCGSDGLEAGVEPRGIIYDGETATIVKIGWQPGAPGGTGLAWAR